MNYLDLIPADDFIWNQSEFTQFLIDCQHQPIKLNTHSEGVCLESSGVYHLLEQFGYKDVTIITNNLLEQHAQYKITLNTPFRFFEIEHGNYSDLHHWNQKKIFGCFYNRPVWHRLALAANLQYDYNDISLINMRSPFLTDDERSLAEIQKLFQNHLDSFLKFSNVFQSWPLLLEAQDGYTVGATTTDHTDQLAKFYKNIFIDVVAETWTSGNTFFPTEKTVRPMLLKKPMIVMGSKDYLCYLRQMGFHTFNEFWSEEYDGYTGRERYLKILELINTLSKKSLRELEYMYASMQFQLDHNYQLLTNQKFNTTITYIE